MERTVTIKIRQSYGHDRYYPVCDNAKTFAKIAGKKCLNDSLLEIKKLGYKIMVQQQEI